MRKSFGRFATGATVGAMALGLVATTTAASAQAATTPSPVPFSSADFTGYASGTGLHVSALTAGTTTLASVDEAFSGASTSTKGLTTAITSETGNVVQPQQPSSVNSYGRGTGLEVGLGTQSGTGLDPNQINLAGRAESTAAPNSPEVVKNINIPANPLINADLVEGKAASVYYTGACPIGQPLSYGNGSAANVGVLDLSGNTNPVINTAGSGTATAQSTSFTSLTPNQGSTAGSYGLSSRAEETIAPLTVNLLDLLTLQVTVAGQNPNAPITLTAHASGGDGPSTVALGNAGLVKITLTPAGGNPVTIETVDLSNPSTLGPDGFLHIPLSTGQLGTALNGVSDALSAVLAGNQVTGPLAPLFGPTGPLNGLVTTAGNTASSVVGKLADVSLGYINIDAKPHAIGGDYTTSPTTSATDASGSIDLIDLHAGLSGSLLGVQLPAALNSLSIADLKGGHLEAQAHLAQPVQCSVPVIKTSSSPTVTAGNNFTYTIQVPDPALAGAVACDLNNFTVTDQISDVNGSIFSVTGASNGGQVDQATKPGTSATVTWTGQSWSAGKTPNSYTIDLAVPANSPAGKIVDTVTVTNATLGNCNGGTTGVTDITGSNGNVLTGTYTLTAPSVAAAGGTAAANGVAPSNDVAPKSLPFTGSIGGLWQPFLGLGALTAGGAALALARRRRR